MLASPIAHPLVGAVVPLVEAAPAIPYIAVALTAIVAWLVVYGLRLTIVTWLGGLLHWMTGIFNLPFGIGNPIQGTVDKGIHYVASLLADAALALENTIAWCFRGIEQVIRLVGDSMAELAHETLHGFRLLVESTIPAIVRELTHPLWKGIDQAEGRLRAIEREALQRLHLGIDTLRRDLAEATQRAEAAARSTAASLERRLGIITHGVEAELQDVVGYTRRNLNVRLRRIEELLATGAIATAALAVLSREIPWFRCTNVQRLGRSACRFPVQLLEALLGGALDALVVTDLCLIARAVRLGVQELRPVIHELFVVGDAALCGGQHGAPDDLVLNAVAPPVPLSPIAL